MRPRRWLWAGVLLAAAGCAGGGGRGDGAAGSRSEPEVDLRPFYRNYARQVREYTDALLMCASPDPARWEEAKRRLAVLHPFRVFDEDPELIRRFREGDDEARKELGRRGAAIESVLVFGEDYDKNRWDTARATLTALGPPGKALLVRALVGILLDGQRQPLWRLARFALVEVGPFALETVAAVAGELGRRSPADSPVFKLDDLAQMTLALLAFGEEGRPHVERLVTHEKANVRRAVARAMGEALDESNIPVLVKMALDDASWAVRTQAVRSLGRMTRSRDRVGKALLSQVREERDPKVRKELLIAIGAVGYVEAIPTLVAMLDFPDAETIALAVEALYRVTGIRKQRKSQWLEWYRTEYPEWLRRRGRRP